LGSRGFRDYYSHFRRGKDLDFPGQQTINKLRMFFPGPERGWASSFNYTNSPYGTVILKTTDGGAEWTSVPYPVENIFINCILFLDSLNGWNGRYAACIG